jgi:putative membrane protein
LAEQGPGPDYRFTLANERTLLAYERTAIGLVAAGLAAVHLLDAEAFEQVLAALLLAAGAVAVVGGYLRFRRVEAAIAAGRPLPANPAAHLLAGIVVVCVAAAAISVVV